MRRVTYLVCALLGVMAAVGIAFLPAGMSLDWKTGTYNFLGVNGTQSKLWVLNPSAGAAVCNVTYTNSQGVVVKSATYNLGPNSYTAIDVRGDVDAAFTGVAAVEWGGQTPVIAYLFNRSGYSSGSCTPGSSTTGTTWGFAGGNTIESKTSENSTYSLVYNPNTQDANCVATFYTAHGLLGSTSIVVPHGQTKTLPGYQFPGMGKTYGVVFNSNIPILAFVRQYWYGESGSALYNAPFQASPGTEFYEPGLSDPNGKTEFHIFNSNAGVTNVTIAHATVQGGMATYQTQVPGQSIATIPTTSLSNYGGHAEITSNNPIFGQTYYWRVDEVNDVNAVSQSPFSGKVWTFTNFAGGQTGPGFTTTHTVGNYNNAPVTGTINYFKEGSGQDPNVVPFQVPANSSKRFNASDVIPNGTFGTLIKVDNPALPVSVVQDLLWGNKEYVSTDFGVGYNNPTTLSVSPETLTLYVRAGHVEVQNNDGLAFIFDVIFTPADASVKWTAWSNTSWLKCPSSGTGTSIGGAGSVNPVFMRRGMTYEGTITVEAPGTVGSPRKISVTVHAL